MPKLTAAWYWAFRQFLQGLFSRKGPALLSYAIVTLALSCPLIAFSIAHSLYAPISSISPAQEITVFTVHGIGQGRLEALRASIESLPGITAARVVSPEEALRQIDQTTQGQYSQPEDNPLPNIILASVDTEATESTVRSTAAAIEKSNAVDSVAYDSTWNTKLAALRKALTEFGVLVCAVPGALLLFVLVCGASLTTAVTPRSAKTLRTLGASPWFVSRPDAWRGAFVFFIAAITALALSDLTVSRLAPSVTEAFSLYSLPISFEPAPALWQLGFAAAAAVLGGVLAGLASLIENRTA